MPLCAAPIVDFTGEGGGIQVSGMDFLVDMSNICFCLLEQSRLSPNDDNA